MRSDESWSVINRFSARSPTVPPEVYRKAKAQEHLPKEEMVNYVKELYDLFTDDEISAKG